MLSGLVLADDRPYEYGGVFHEVNRIGNVIWCERHQEDRRERPLPTGTVTLLLSDVEGSTRLWEADEEAAAAAIARHYELFDAAIAAHRGVRPVEQGEGDSVVAAFALASDAAGRSGLRPARLRGGDMADRTGGARSASPCTAVRLGCGTKGTTTVRRSSGVPACGPSRMAARPCSPMPSATSWSMDSPRACP